MRNTSLLSLTGKLAAGLTGVVVVYALAGFFLLPTLVQASLGDYFRDQLGLDAHFESAAVNPFTLTVTLTGTRLASGGQDWVLDVPEARADFRLAGLVQQPLTVARLGLSAPRLEMKIETPAGTGLGAALWRDMRERFGAAGPPPMRVNAVSIDNGRAVVPGRARADAGLTLEAIVFRVRGLATDSGGIDYRLDFIDGRGGDFHFRGWIDAPGGSGEGEFAVRDLEAATLPGWLGRLPGVEGVTGTVAGDGRYAISPAGGGFSLHVRDAAFTLRATRLEPRGRPAIRFERGAININVRLRLGETAPVIETAGGQADFTSVEIGEGETADRLERVRIADGDYDRGDRRLNIASVRISDGELSLLRRSDGGLAWPAAGMDAKAWSGLPDDWRLTLDTLVTEALSLTFIDAGPATPAVQRFGDIELQLNDLHTGKGPPAAFELGLSVNNAGALAAAGRFNPAAATLTAAVKFKDLDLVPFAPYLQGVTPLNLRSALASAELDVALDADGVSAEGRLEARKIRLARDGGEPLLLVAALSAPEVAFRSRPLTVSAATVTVQGLQAELEQDASGSINPGGWLHRRSGSGPLVVAIEELNVIEAGAGFIDRSLTPALRLRAENLIGGLYGLRLAVDTGDAAVRPGPDRPLDFVFAGRLTKAGFVRLAGRLQQQTGAGRIITLNLRDMDARELSPYAAQHLGRGIDAGRLSLDITALSSGDPVRGHYRLVLRGFESGAEALSPGPGPQSLDLAAALLRDADGRIELAGPLSGASAGQGFQLHALAGQSVAEDLAAAVDKPFETLGKTVGAAGELLAAVPFQPGSAEIIPAARQRLALLSRALKQRPGLGLRIAGGFEPGRDRDALARQQVRLHVSLAATTGPPGRSGKDIDFADPRVQEVLDEFALARLGRDKPAAPPDGQGGKSDSAAWTNYYRKIFAALVREEAISGSALESLAKYRRQSIIGRLKELGVPGDRIITAGSDRQAGSANGQVFVELDLVSHP